MITLLYTELCIYLTFQILNTSICLASCFNVEGVLLSFINPLLLYRVYALEENILCHNKRCKKHNIPSKDNLIRKVLECAELDKLTKEIQEKEETEHYLVWEKWYQWLKERDKRKGEIK